MNIENLAKDWKCPQCGDTRIEEIMFDVVVATVIDAVYGDGDCDFGEQTNDSGIVDRYQCVQCGTLVCDAKDMKELSVFFQKSI